LGFVGDLHVLYLILTRKLLNLQVVHLVARLKIFEWSKFLILILQDPVLVIVIALLLRIMDTLRIFDQIFIMTGGGPANATETLSLYIYRHGFRFYNIGYATAMSFLLLIFTVVISNFFIRFLKTEKVFE
jgi:ABC-type sugar transport system permease subunit